MQSQCKRRWVGTVAAAAAVLAITSWSAPGQAGAARPCTPSPAGLIFGCGGPVVAPGDPVIADGACSVGLTGHIGAAEYAVTAGHCFHAGAQVKDATGKPIGWYEFGRPDLGHTDQFGFALIHLYDNVFTSAGTPTYHLAAIDTKPTVGQQICKEGRTTRKTCGHITEVSAEHIFADSLFDNPGDSGGVVYREAAAGQVWLVGIIYGYKTSNHGAVIEPAARLLDQIRQYAPHPFQPNLARF